VTRAYRSGEYLIEALRPTSLTISAGDFLGVMGPSGSGKSTLLNLLGLLVRPSDGAVLVDGMDTGRLSDASISAMRGVTLGFVFQSFHLLGTRTVLANVELPLVYGRVPRARRRKLAMDALTAVGLSERQAAFPNELSGGERQRVAIARAVVRRPRLLLCDEPTGNLDSLSAHGVMALLEKLNRSGIAIVVATHNYEVAGYASRRLNLHDGVANEVIAASEDA
jgi:putative ABC transport system ATP-binding protein